MITLEFGHIQNAANVALANGSITFQLNVDATVISAPYGFVAAAAEVVFQFDATGNLIQPCQIWSNIELNPQNSEGLGTYYLVAIYDANGAKVSGPMWWQFTEAANSTVDISEMVPFATVGGNVIFYPTSFTINPPAPTVLGGVFSNAGAPSEWIRAINTNGSVSLSQPAFTDISGQITAAQLPSPLVFGATSFSGLVTAQAGIEIGVVGTTSGQIALDGSTSGQVLITAPAAAGTATNPVVFTNSIQIPSTAAFSIGGSTGISQGSAAVLDVGNGSAGDATGTVNAAAYQVAGSQIAASNLANGTTGTGAIVLKASPTITGTLTAGLIAASDTLTTVAQPTLRLVDSELTVSSTVTTITAGGSVASVRGNTTLATGGTISAGYIYGVQGKITLQGTLSTANFTAGVFAQLDLSAAQALSAPNVAAIWGDMGATISAAVISSGEALLDILHLTSTAPGSMINAAIHVEALSTYLLDVSNVSYPSGWNNSAVVGSTQVGRLKIKTPTGDAYINLMSVS